jgi:hypothetical protein
VHRGPDAVADELADDARGRPGRDRFDRDRDVLDVIAGTAAAMPAIIASRVRSMSSATRGGGSPT